MKEINLTKGYKAKVDDEDYQWLVDNFSFHYSSGYARSTKIVDGHRVSLAMHRIILERYGSIPDGLEPDHIDRDKLNNQRSNLRLVTHKENCNNREPADPTCPKCGVRERYRKNYAYCKECFLEYMKERRKNNPELKKKSTEYKREYRARKKAERLGQDIKKD